MVESADFGSDLAAIAQTEKPVIPVRSHVVDVEDKLGEKYKVTYLRTEGKESVIDTQEAQQYLPELIALSKDGFPDIDETNIKDKFAGYQGIDIVRGANQEAVGYHVYKFTEVQEGEAPLKVMYTSFAVTNSAYTGRNLTEVTRMPAIEIEQPDILAGSSNEPAIYLTNQRIAQKKGLVMYPTDTHTPDAIVDLGNKVLSTIVKKPPLPGEPPLIGPNLVRPRDPKETDKPKPFFDAIVPIKPHEQLFYLLLKPQVNTRLVAAK